MSTKWYVRTFFLLSDAIAFQAKKRRQGWQTKKITHSEAGWPYTEVLWRYKSIEV